MGHIWIIVTAIFILFGGMIWAATTSSTPTLTSSTSVSVPQEIPLPTDYAMDIAHILTTDQMLTLNARLKELDTEKHQFGVLIVETTKPEDIEQYSMRVAEKWKVGNAKLDNGAILVIASEDRKVRIEVGYGLEGDINDAKAGRILDEKGVPLLKQGKWFEAIMAIINELDNQTK